VRVRKYLDCCNKAMAWRANTPYILPPECRGERGREREREREREEREGRVVPSFGNFSHQ